MSRRPRVPVLLPDGSVRIPFPPDPALYEREQLPSFTTTLSDGRTVTVEVYEYRPREPRK